MTRWTITSCAARAFGQTMRRYLAPVDRAMTRPEGLRGRPWYRNLIYVADVDNGYGTMVFPSVNEAIRYGTTALFTEELADLVRRFDAATAALERAAREVKGSR